MQSCVRATAGEPACERSLASPIPAAATQRPWPSAPLPANPPARGHWRRQYQPRQPSAPGIECRRM